MLQHLFDVYMAEKLSHLFSLYLRKREATTVKDPVLSKKKKDKVGFELEKCREIVTDKQSNIAWEAHLNTFAQECKSLVTSYDNSAYPINSFGTLVTDFIEEAKLFLKEANKLFILFGLDKVTVEGVTADVYQREKLLNLCMARLYYPGAMQPQDWQKMREFCTHMSDTCEVSLGQEKETTPTFREYTALEVAANKWLKREEAALKIAPSDSDQHEQKQNDAGMMSSAQSVVVHATSKLYSAIGNSLSGMWGSSSSSSPMVKSNQLSSSSSSSSSMPVLTLSPSALNQLNNLNKDTSVHGGSHTSRNRSNSVKSNTSLGSNGSGN